MCVRERKRQRQVQRQREQKDRVSLCSSGYPGALYIDQAIFKQRDTPISTSQVLRLNNCMSVPDLSVCFAKLT